MQTEQPSRPTSVRWWESRRNNIGAILAILAAVFTLAVSRFPIGVPQARGPIGVSWGTAAILIGVVYIAAFFLADRRWNWARWFLVGGALVQIVIGAVSGIGYGAIAGWPGHLAGLYDIAPAVVALVAAALIGPPLRQPGMPPDRPAPIEEDLPEGIAELLSSPDLGPAEWSRRADSRRAVRASAGRTAVEAAAVGATAEDEARRNQIEPGMYVVGADGHEIGQVKEVRLADFLVDQADGPLLYVPHHAVDRFYGDRLRLNVSAGRAEELGWVQPALAEARRPDGF
jgi:hypothetical protein